MSKFKKINNKNSRLKNKLSRRILIKNLSLGLAGLGVSPLIRQEIISSKFKKLFPHANGADATPVRLLDISIRQGAPLMRLVASQEFLKFNQATYANMPFRGSELVAGENRSVFSPHTSGLAQYSKNIAATFAALSDGPHSEYFPHLEGGLNKGLASPIVKLAARNTTKSLINGVKLGGRTINRDVFVKDKTQTYQDLLFATNDTFISSFKKPSLSLDEQTAALIIEASQQLSLAQADILEKKLSKSRQIASIHKKGQALLKADFSQVLNISDMASDLITAPDLRYKIFGETLAYSLKGFANNLINTSRVILDTEDWHSTVNNGIKKLNFDQEMGKKLVEVIKYLQSTPEPTLTDGSSLWDTTVISINSEFTRSIAKIGTENWSDGPTNGTILIGKNINGGYYGNIDTNEDESYGFDRNTGAPLSNKKMSEAELYHTLLAAVKDPDADSNLTMNCILK